MSCEVTFSDGSPGVLVFVVFQNCNEL